MKIKSFFLSVVCVGFVLVSTSCDQNDSPTPVRIETDHFILISDTERSTPNENTAVLNKAESLYAQILEIVGEHRTPQNKINHTNGRQFYIQRPLF